MSILDANARTAAGRQKLAILSEAQAAGVPILACIDDDPKDATADAGELAHLVGPMRSRSFQALLFDLDGQPHLYVQPYDGAKALPGEHHTWMSGAFRSPVVQRGEAEARRWDSHDHELTNWLMQDPELDAFFANQRWLWTSGAGEIRYPWHVQLRPLRGGSTQMAMMAFGDGPGREKRAGVVEFRQLQALIHQRLTPYPDVVAAPFLVRADYEELFEAAVRGEIQPRRPASTMPADFGRLVAPLLGKARRRYYVGQIPAKVESGARSAALPPGWQRVPILAVVDLTTMGSGKEALVVTPTHVIYREGPVRVLVAWSDLLSVEPPGYDDCLWVEVAALGKLRIPTGPSGSALHAAFDAVARSSG